MFTSINLRCEVIVDWVFLAVVENEVDYLVEVCDGYPSVFFFCHKSVFKVKSEEFATAEDLPSVSPML